MASDRASQKEDRAPSRPAAAGGSTVDKLLEQAPPFDERAEVGVLGSMLMESSAAAVAIEELKVEDFYLPRHRILFKTFSELYETQKSDIDELLLCSVLERKGLLESVGGKEAVGRLIMDVPSAGNVESYCQLVRGRAIERELIVAAGQILRMAREPSAVGSQELVEAAEKIVYDIADKRMTKNVASMTELMAKVVEEAESVQAALREGREVPNPALPTKYIDLDNLLTGGLWPGELIVIAGRPSMGKTTFALNIARHVSVGNENEVKPCAIFTLEMPGEQVAKNILCAQSELQGQKMRRCIFDKEELVRLDYGIKQVKPAPLFIDDTSGLSLGQLRARCRRLHHFNDIKLVIVDYLQLMQGSPFAKNREQEVSELSRGLKALARDLRIPVIVLSQLNRAAERRENEDKRPQLADLRESGAIEQDADVVIMLYRQEYYDLGSNTKNENTGEALVLKNRNGPVGKVTLTFRKDILSFESYTQQTDSVAGG